MAQPLEQKKRQKILLGILLIAVVITAFVWYFNFQKGPSISGVQPGGSFVSTITEQKIREIKLDFSALDNALFKALKSHGILPISPGETGRDNPFQF